MIFEAGGSGNYNVATEDDLTSTANTFSGCGGSPSGNGLGNGYGASPIQGYVTTGGTLVLATGNMPGAVAEITAFGFAPQIGLATGRHTGSNYMFADGHAKYLRSEQVSPGASANKETDQQQYVTSGIPNAAGTSGTFDGTNQPAATFSLE